jgi:hypothetical protein
MELVWELDGLNGLVAETQEVADCFLHGAVSRGKNTRRFRYGLLFLARPADEQRSGPEDGYGDDEQNPPSVRMSSLPAHGVRAFQSVSARVNGAKELNIPVRFRRCK